MTHDFNLLLEQYNLANFNTDDEFDEYYWNVAEQIGQVHFSSGTLTEHDIIDLLTDMLELDESDINIDEIEPFLDEIFEIIKEG